MITFKIRKATVAILVFCLVMGLSACGSSGGSESGSESGSGVLGEIKNTKTPDPTDAPDVLLQDISGLYTYKSDSKTPAGVEIIVVSGDEVYFAVHYVRYGDEVEEASVAYLTGKLVKAGAEDKTWKINYEGHDTWGNPVSGSLSVDRNNKTCDLSVVYVSEMISEGNMYDMKKCKLTGKAETSLSVCMTGIAEQEAAYNRYKDWENEYNDERKDKPYVEDFGELSQIDTLDITLMYEDTYSDGVWYYMIFVEENGLKMYAYTDARWNLTPGAYYDIKGRLFYGNHYVLAIDKMDEHDDRSDDPGYDIPELSSRVENLDHDAVFYDEKTGLFVLSNVSSNGAPFRMDGIRFIDLEEGILSFVADMHSVSSNDYIVWMNIKLLAKDGSVLKTYSGEGFSLENINIRRPNQGELTDDDAINYPTYVMSASNMSDISDHRLTKITGGSSFVVPIAHSWQQYIGEQYLLISRKLDKVNKEIYGIYVTIDDYFAWNTIY